MWKDCGGSNNLEGDGRWCRGGNKPRGVMRWGGGPACHATASLIARNGILIENS